MRLLAAVVGRQDERVVGVEDEAVGQAENDPGCDPLQQHCCRNKSGTTYQRSIAEAVAALSAKPFMFRAR